MRRAVVIGATGQIGRVAVGALARDGWEVTAVSRGGGRDGGWPDEVRVTAADRADDAALAAAVGDGCDVLVDMVAYGPEHARQLTGLAGRVGSAVVISSVSVYEDDKGRNFDTQAEPDGFPEYPVPDHARTSARSGRARVRTAPGRRRWNVNSSPPATSCRSRCCGRARSTDRTAEPRASCTSSSATWTGGAGVSSPTAVRAGSIRRASTTSPS